ncbi:MAG: SirB1 family protein [Chromatiales bacterium]|jgi:regulator of sirC expression with transglutaminase-like and TPR domain
MMETPGIQRIRKTVGVPDTDLDLLDAALVIAASEYPAINVDSYHQRLDEWASELRARIETDASAEDRLRALNAFLFQELGFSGNTDDYYDPRNSYLNEVLDRKLGVPITLSMIYMALGQRIGLPLEGVSFPGHFLVKLPVDGGAVVLDPFNGGISLDEHDLCDLLERMFDTEVSEVAPLLTTASKTDILIRMLRNLKGIHQQGDEYDKALRVVNMIIAIDPHLEEEYRDRGLLLLQLECRHAALKDLRHYLSADPEAEDAESIRDLIVELGRSDTPLH